MAQAKATTVQLSSIGVGPATNYPVATSVSYNSTDFQSSSFTTTAAGMAGGLLSVNGTSAGSTQYVYSPSGAKIAVLQGGQLVKGTVPLPGGGTAVYNASGFGYFRHKDWLGSSRLATNWDHTVYSKEAYAPFGETENNMEQTSSTGQADRSFTGEDQDTTSGIFDYLFRRYDPVAGRWLSPDPSGWGSVSQSNPQSLNRYAYVQNNPMQLTDPDGLDCVYASDIQFSGGSVIVPGDCKDPNDNGIYIDAKGVTSASVNANGDLEDYTIGNDYYNGNGTFVGTFMSTSVSDYVFNGQPNYMDASVAPTTLPSSPTSGTPSIPTIPKSAPSNPTSNLPSCLGVGAKAVMQAGADTLGPVTDAAGAVKQMAEEGLNMASMYFSNKAAFYSATTINTAGTVGLLVPLRSSTYRGLLSTSAELGEAASGAWLGLLDYNLGKQIYNEIANPTPCR